MFSQLWTLLGSRHAVVTETDGTLSVFSTSIGFAWFWVILGAGLFLVIAADSLRRDGFAGLRRGAGVMGFLAACLAIVIGLGYGAMKLEAGLEEESLTLTRWTVLGASVQDVPLARLEAIDLGTGTIKAPTRNGTPQGSDKTGYVMRLRLAGPEYLDATPMASGEGKERSAEAIRALLGFLDGHPALEGRELKTNLDRLGL